MHNFTVMNVQLIENLIISNNETCPELTYSNPLLDKDVALALSKSFIKILNISKENSNEKLRHTVLENIRNTCKIEPDDHVEIDEDITELLIAYFEKLNEETENFSGDNLKKKLDDFLIRTENTIRSSVTCPITPEVVQALLNLNNKIKNQDALVQDIIHWNQEDKKCMTLLKYHWNCHKNLNFSRQDKYKQFLDDASIKISTEIEKLLLDIACEILNDDNLDLDEILNKNVNKTLIEISAVSTECFQICISILNTLFIMNNFHFKIQKLILVFLKKVKLECKLLTTAVLYPIHLNSIAVLLDIDIEKMRSHLEIRTMYSNLVNKYLSELQKQSETELILMLSHFPQWSSIYFKHEENIISPMAQ